MQYLNINQAKRLIVALALFAGGSQTALAVGIEIHADQRRRQIVAADGAGGGAVVGQSRSRGRACDAGHGRGDPIGCRQRRYGDQGAGGAHRNDPAQWL